MTRKRPLTPEEEQLWRQVMKDTEPLGQIAREPSTPQESGRPFSAKPTHHGHPPPPKKVAQKISGAMPPVIRHAQERTLNAQNAARSPADLSDLDRKSQQRVRRGKIEVDAKIDLHGMRQSEAHQALIARVSRARLDGKRVLLVVTGKGASKGGSTKDGSGHGSQPFWARGGGVLKAQVPKWLREDPLRSMIFSVQEAHQRHGGAGALYVFLKRVR